MKIRSILPAFTEARSPNWRPIKYSLFPPLGLATLAACCAADDEIDLQDEHVEQFMTEECAELIQIHLYINNAFRACTLADFRQKAPQKNFPLTWQLPDRGGMIDVPIRPELTKGPFRKDTTKERTTAVGRKLSGSCLKKIKTALTESL